MLCLIEGFSFGSRGHSSGGVCLSSGGDGVENFSGVCPHQNMGFLYVSGAQP